MSILKKIFAFPTNVLFRLRGFLYVVFFGLVNLIIGTLLVLAGVFILVALVSYNALDQSLNTISDNPPLNLLGNPGSYISDIIVQFFGILSIIIPVILIIFGFLKIIKKLENSLIKVLLVFIGLFLLSAPFEKSFSDGGIFGSLSLEVIESLVYKLSLAINFDLLENNLFIYLFYISLGFFSSLLITYGLLPGNINLGVETANKSKIIETEILSSSEKVIKNKRIKFPSLIKKERKKEKPPPPEESQVYENTRGYSLPSLDLLSDVPSERKENTVSDKKINENKELLATTLKDFGINGKRENSTNKRHRRQWQQ